MLKCETVSVPEAGAILGLGRNGSYEAVRRGDIPAIRLGKKLRVPKAVLERMLNSAETGWRARQPAAVA
jgi:excisionase family DNA binding protein